MWCGSKPSVARSGRPHRRADGCGFRTSCWFAALLRGPGGCDRNGEERAHRSQNCGNPQFHRIAGIVSASGGRAARRPRHGGKRGCGAGTFSQRGNRRNAGTVGHNQAAEGPIDCDDRRHDLGRQGEGARPKHASTLATAADVALDCSIAEEACALGLAPTASTTTMLALGDALAVTLSEKRGFKEEDFANLHPGGKLGKRLARVESLMHIGDALPCVDPKTKMPDVIYEMSRKKTRRDGSDRWRKIGRHYQ